MREYPLRDCESCMFVDSCAHIQVMNKIIEEKLVPIDFSTAVCTEYSENLNIEVVGSVGFIKDVPPADIADLAELKYLMIDEPVDSKALKDIVETISTMPEHLEVQGVYLNSELYNRIMEELPLPENLKPLDGFVIPGRGIIDFIIDNDMEGEDYEFEVPNYDDEDEQ